MVDVRTVQKYLLSADLIRSYKEMMHFLNNTLEDVIKQFYDEEEIFNNIKSNSKAINFDSYYKRETGISLLEKYGFLEAIKKYNKKMI